MYGGTRGSLSVVTVGLVLLGAMTGCQEQDRQDDRAIESSREETRSGASDAEVLVGYDTWQPTYRDVRPATPDDVVALRTRVADLNATTYTVEVLDLGIEIASSPEHVRVAFGAGAPGGFDLHLDPQAAGEELLDIGSFVVCSTDDGSCVEVGEDPETGGGPHLFNNGIDTIVFTSGNIVASQRAMAEALDALAASDDGGASVAVVDSPGGALDCLVTGGTPRRRDRLDGSAVDLAADPFSPVGGPRPLTTICVDEHGLVVLTVPSLLSPVVPYGSFTAGVPSGFDEHPEPVPYGTSPAATPTDSEAEDQAGEVRTVVVAAGPIEAGESLTSVQQTGRLELDQVLPDEQVPPGSVSSTNGLDGVALRDIAAGEVITQDSFG